MDFNAFRSGILQLAPIESTGHLSYLALNLKIITPKQMLRRLATASIKIKAGYTSEKLLNEIHQIIYFLYCA